MSQFPGFFPETAFHPNITGSWTRLLNSITFTDTIEVLMPNLASFNHFYSPTLIFKLCMYISHAFLHVVLCGIHYAPLLWWYKTLLWQTMKSMNFPQLPTGVWKISEWYLMELQETRWDLRIISNSCTDKLDYGTLNIQSPSIENFRDTFISADLYEHHKELVNLKLFNILFYDKIP